jgi:hypothetical protein
MGLVAAQPGGRAAVTRQMTVDYLAPTRTSEVDAANALIVWACFACGYVCTDEDLHHCARCGILTHRESAGAAVCDSCTADYFSRN